ncbi:DUF4426 domain-containing protein [Noviherbaspirillum pedocola]|uniref:DUF4426 domain-containing protein n=1 Tax=Noviherbaspirillum pedocola TaxID=2801341 RepID=UPI002D7F6870|nr:DUF4426 domain-containing protein [Noviherbaspirillum pedocola]
MPNISWMRTAMNALYRQANTRHAWHPSFSPAFVISVMLLVGLVMAPGAVLAQSHSVSEGPYVLRASTVSSESLPEETARANGIHHDPRRGVLNVMVAEKKDRALLTTHARVHADARDLTGQRRRIPMREIDSNGSVTYLGTYDFVEGEVIDFLIEAEPMRGDRKLRLTFRDRLWTEK